MDSTATPLQSPSFATTHWSVVLAAGKGESPQATAALEELCRAYWYPLYAYVRRHGHSPHDAEDLTQTFLARLLARKSLESVAQSRGKFRSFLLVALKHFLSDEWDRLRAQKRGGGQHLISLDAQAAESRYHLEARDEASPEKLYDRRWALTLLDRALDRLRDEHILANKAEAFAELRVFLTGDRGEVSYGTVAARLNTTESAAKMTVHRMRQRYRELLRAEIANTVGSVEEIDGELRCLVTALRGPDGG